MRPARARGARIEDDALIVDFLLGRSPASMHLCLMDGEPFLRVRLQVDWRERRRLLRVENWFAVTAQSASYGAPHGVTVRSTIVRTPQDRAKFEVPGQRFCMLADDAGDGVAVFALDTYGWNAHALQKGGTKLGHSLLRGTQWPDPLADLGEHELSYAFAPLRNAGYGALEAAWLQFAHADHVRLFTSDDPAVLAVACKPAQDGDGVIVRVRECDGERRRVRLRCGARMTRALSVDALERAIGRDVAIEGESLLFDLPAYELRSFRVAFSHA